MIRIIRITRSLFRSAPVVGVDDICSAQGVERCARGRSGRVSQPYRQAVPGAANAGVGLRQNFLRRCLDRRLSNRCGWDVATLLRRSLSWRLPP
jgi:hypothetical protein